MGEVMETFEGYSLDIQLRNDETIYIGRVPERKSIALGVHGPGNRIDIVAYFRNVEAANRFLQMLYAGSGNGEG